MQRNFGAVLGILWVQIFCELCSTKFLSIRDSPEISGGGEKVDENLCILPHGYLLGYLTGMSENLSLILVFFFCFQAGVRGVEVEQSPLAMSLQEGTSSDLRCNFSTTMTTVQWFLQNPRGGLINLFYLVPGTKEIGRLKSTFNSKERYSTLHIKDAHVEDSGIYLCAAQAQCSQPTYSLAPNCSWVCSSCHRQTLQVASHNSGFIRSPPITENALGKVKIPRHRNKLKFRLM